MSEIIKTEEISELLKNRKIHQLREIFSEMNEVDIASILEELPAEQLPIAFRILPKEIAADAFSYFTPETQEELIKAFSDRELAYVIDNLFVDDTVDMIEEMPANVVKRILKHTDPETRKQINEILQYPKDSAGSIMTTEYVRLQEDLTVEQAFKRIKSTGVEKETIYTCYVTNNKKEILGIVTVKDMLFANSDDLIKNIMETNIIYVNTLDDREDVVHILEKYNFIALPVVDKELRLVGIITFDDAMDVIRNENTEDLEVMNAITPTDKPYMRTTVVETYKKRIPWLLILMISATFTGAIISHYEEALGAYVILTAYIPMLMDTGGNAGSQASVTIVRGISLGEIEFKNIFKIQRKEFIVSILCGVTLGLANLAKLLFFDRVGITIALVVCLTLVATVIVAKFVGCTLPIVAKKIGFDPAVMASPFITTIVDAISLLIYFQFASHILHI